MPLYEYECRNCQNSFDVIQKSTDSAPACPVCKSPETNRKISSFASSGGCSAPSGFS